MKPTYIQPYYSAAAKIAETVRALPRDAWIRMAYFTYRDDMAPLEPEIIQPDDWEPRDVGLMVMAGDWIDQFDAEWAYENQPQDGAHGPTYQGYYL